MTNAYIGSQFNDIIWRGVTYLDICRMEKLDVESKLKDEIREEIEMKKLNRGTGNSLYSRLIN